METKKHVTLYLNFIIEYMIQAMATTTHVKQVLAKCVMVVNLQIQMKAVKQKIL